MPFSKNVIFPSTQIWRTGGTELSKPMVIGTVCLLILSSFMVPTLKSGKLSSVASITSTSAIQNGGFEDGLNDWNQHSNGGFLSVTSEYAHTGNYSLKISTSVGEYAYVYQYVSCPYTGYVFSFWVYRADPSNEQCCQLATGWYGNDSPSAKVVSYFVLRANTIEVDAWDDDTVAKRQTINYNVTSGGWHNVVFVVDESSWTQKLYIDKDLVATLNSSLGYVFSPNAAVFNDVPTQNCYGTTYLDDVKLASSAIFIRADGSIDYSGPTQVALSTDDNITYVITSNVSNPIVVERSNILIDGAGHCVQGGLGDGFSLYNIENVTIKDTEVDGFDFPINLNCSSQCVILGCNLTDGVIGVLMYSTSVNNSVENNRITWNDVGIESYENCSGNSIIGNYIAENGIKGKQPQGQGIFISGASNIVINNTLAGNQEDMIVSGSGNIFYHNNIIKYISQVATYKCANSWDGGYVCGGNYWSDYKGTDLFSGPYQNVSGSDGIGDVPYVIDASDIDNYPLMGAYSEFDVAGGYQVQVVSNSTTSNLQFNETTFSLNATGIGGTTGFCRARVPTTLMNDTFQVFVNGAEVSYNVLPISNQTYNFLYFNYLNSAEQVPEFPFYIIISLLVGSTLVTLVGHSRNAKRST
jgi:hypothetical protein